MPNAENHRAYVFIDAAQLRAKLDESNIDWSGVNLSRLGKVVTGWLNRDRWLDQDTRPSRVFIYDAVGETGNPDVEQWLAKNDRLTGVHARRGALAGEGRRASKSQKAVDVRLTVDALTWANHGAFDVAVLVTGDGDFSPLVEALRDRGIFVAVAAFNDRLSPLLATEADCVFSIPEGGDFWTEQTLP